MHTGCGAAWLARLSGGQEVGSSNLPSPTDLPGVSQECGAPVSRLGDGGHPTDTLRRGRCRGAALRHPDPRHLGGRRWRKRRHPVVAATLFDSAMTIRRVTARGLVDVGQPAQGGHDVEAVTVAEHARHRHRSRELPEVLGGRLVGHSVDHDAGVSRSTTIDSGCD